MKSAGLGPITKPALALLVTTVLAFILVTVIDVLFDDPPQVRAAVEAAGFTNPHVRQYRWSFQCSDGDSMAVRVTAVDSLGKQANLIVCCDRNKACTVRPQ